MALTALVVVGLRAAAVEPVRVAGVSMAPTLKMGDVVVVNKRDRTPERGNLVTLRSPVEGERTLMRVVGVGGDAAVIRDAILFVNDVEVQEPYVDHKSIEALYDGPVTVSKSDSRTYGEVPLQDVTGTLAARPGPCAIPSSQ